MYNIRLVVSACGDKEYSPYEHFCCGAGDSAALYHKSQYRGCCGDQGLRNDSNVRCCGGKSYTVRDPVVGNLQDCCAGKEIYYLEKDVCCGEIQGVKPRYIDGDASSSCGEYPWAQRDREYILYTVIHTVKPALKTTYI